MAIFSVTEKWLVSILISFLNWCFNNLEYNGLKMLKEKE